MKKSNNFILLMHMYSSFSQDIQKNILSARKYLRFIVDEADIQLTPHLSFLQFIDKKIIKDRKYSSKFGNRFMNKCNGFLVFGEHISKDTECEMKGKCKIKYFSEDLKGVKSNAETKNSIWK